jgi:hypothetical protein
MRQRTAGDAVSAGSSWAAGRSINSGNQAGKIIVTKIN